MSGIGSWLGLGLGSVLGLVLGLINYGAICNFRTDSRFQVTNEYLLFYEVVTVPIGRN